MLTELTAKQFGEWMAFYLAERQIHDEARQQAELESEALRGAEEIRGKLRS